MTEESKRIITFTDCILSNEIVTLYNSAAVQNVNEGVTVLFHAFLLESGFIPKDASDKDIYGSMPESWKKNKTFKYAHYCCPTYTCRMTCVPLYSTVSVHGIVCDVDCPESVDFKVNVNKYLKSKSNFSDVYKAFCNLEELSRLFKDQFCLPILNLLHEIGKKPLYGMPGLLEELKMYILQHLPVEGVVLMSAVNKNFHSLANSTFLWKYLLQRDFSKGSLLDIDSASSEPNWKQIYKKEYLKIKRSKETRMQRLPDHPYHLPQIFSMRPDYDLDTDVGTHFDPPFPDMYPPFIPPRPLFMPPRPPFLRRLLQ